jgi:TolB-like protein/Tfp pilus assembly protein PilF
MFADVSGYTALTQQNESFALQVLSEVKQLTTPVLEKHGGRLVKTMGDGLLVEFSSAMDAVLCGIELQNAMRERRRASAVEPVQLKVGIHVGDVIHDDGDVLGDAVNIASRIEPLAGPGGICISSDVMNQVKTRLAYATTPMGPQKLKNVANPVETYRVLLPWDRESPIATQEAGRDKRRLAVLPLSSFSPDPNDEYFADGMMEEIISKLSGVNGLKVIARTSAMKYKGVRKSVLEIGSELGVGSVLEGSVRKSGQRVRITLQLIDASTEEHLWANSYDRDLTDIFAVQTDIAQSVAGSLEVKLLEKDLEALGRPGTRNLSAYSHYLRGIRAMPSRTEAGLKEAKTEFEAAIAEDPSFARAYSGLADCTMVMANYAIISQEEGGTKARPLVIKALELDDGLAEAHASLALLLGTYDLDWTGAEREFKRALQINPGYATAHHWYANLLSALGRTDEMLAEAQSALELDPLSAGIAAAAGIAFYYTGDYTHALALNAKVHELSPQNRGGRFMLPLVLAEMGRMDEAIAEGRRSVEETSHRADSLGALGWVLGRAGRTEEAKRIVQEMEELKLQGKALAGDIWFAYAPLGDLDRAFEYHNQAIDSRDQDISVLRLAPGLDAMRADPRYEALLKRLHLTSGAKSSSPGVGAPT